MSPGVPETAHRLVLLRHAKSAWPSGVPDHERPLAGKGRRNAHAAGEWFTTAGPRPDLVLISDAVRTQQTWEIVRGAFPAAPRSRLEPRIYLADVSELLEVMHEVDESVGTLCLVGHEPGMSSTALTLASPDSERAVVSAVAGKFPTSAVAVLALTGTWAGLEPRGALLESFSVPRASGS